MTADNKVALDKQRPAVDAWDALALIKHYAYCSERAQELMQPEFDKAMETLETALTAPAVDVEELKAEQRRYFNAYDPDLSNALYNHGDALIDHLAARGYFGNVKEK